MANPVRNYDDPRDPRLAQDPINPVPPLGPDPRTPEPRIASNDPRPGSTTVVQADRGAGTGVLIAAVVIVLALVAYFVFGRDGTDTVAPPEQHAATEPAAPGAAAPAAPADQAAPAPQAAEPAAPAPGATAPAPEATEPAAPAPQATQPSETAPAAPAQPAPAQ